AGARAAGIVVAVDRQERGRGELSAIQEVERDFGVEVASIIGFDQIIAYLEQTGRHAEHLDAVRAYRDEFGVLASRPSPSPARSRSASARGQGRCRATSVSTPRCSSMVTAATSSTATGTGVTRPSSRTWTPVGIPSTSR